MSRFYVSRYRCIIRITAPPAVTSPLIDASCVNVAERSEAAVVPVINTVAFVYKYGLNT